jgi:hypothetical protein
VHEAAQILEFGDQGVDLARGSTGDTLDQRVDVVDGSFGGCIRRIAGIEDRGRLA